MKTQAGAELLIPYEVQEAGEMTPAELAKLGFASASVRMRVRRVIGLSQAQGQSGASLGLKAERNSRYELPVFQEEVLRATPPNREEQDRIRKLVEAFNSEVDEAGDERHLLGILAASTRRLKPHPALQESIRELISTFRETPPGEPLDKIKIKNNLAYQALI